jgi:hypothetical protein
LHSEQYFRALKSKGLSKCSIGDFAKGSEFSVTCIGENDIDSHLGRDGFVETIKVPPFGNVPLNASDIAASCFYGLVELLLTTACDEDIGALFYEELSGGQSYRGRTSSNHCYFPCSFSRFGQR